VYIKLFTEAAGNFSPDPLVYKRTFSRNAPRLPSADVKIQGNIVIIERE